MHQQWSYVFLALLTHQYMTSFGPISLELLPFINHRSAIIISGDGVTAWQNFGIFVLKSFKTMSRTSNIFRVLHVLNTLRPRQNGRHFADDIFKCIFLNENVWIPFKISLKFVPKGAINNIPALVQIMAWRRSGDKPLSEPMMVGLPTHICVTRPHSISQPPVHLCFAQVIELNAHPEITQILSFSWGFSSKVAFYTP